LATTAETWKLFEVSAVADVAPHPPAMTPASIAATMRYATGMAAIPFRPADYQASVTCTTSV
jgi:hypothetical protein